MDYTTYTGTTMNLTVTCTHAMDQGMSAEEARDVFVLRDDAGTDLFEVTLLNDFAGYESLSCRKLAEVDASCLPTINSGTALAAKLIDFLDTQLQEHDCEFYGDLFWDEEGNERALTLTLTPAPVLHAA